jgi:phosphoribosylformimino-5-aminoimidazole carboxamide ribotide isomerase
MDVIPAVDLMDGSVVRLLRGDPTTSKRYADYGNPVETAQRWADAGAPMIHVVDLDAAIGRGDNLPVIAEITRSVPVPVQVGGGIRSFDVARRLFAQGVARIIVATLALEREPVLRRLLASYGDTRIMVALDYLHGTVMKRGWTRTTVLTLEEALATFQGIGVSKFLLTAISQDGRLAGPDVATLRGVVRTVEAEIFAAGGVTSLDDVARLKRVGVTGIVVGKALYEGRFTLEDALQCGE